MIHDADRVFMRLAIQEARKGLGQTSPNPTVGAVLVKGGRVIARGYHARAGEAHAEVVALEAAGARARGADLYTTLEPCDHFGRTPPCSLAILAAGVRRVVSASSDPNPRVRGRGVARLRKHGIRVDTGVLADEADPLNRPFFKVMRTGLPWVTLKVAVTLDGKLADAKGRSKWISGPQSRLRVHQLRSQVDAILVGAGTVLRDDPRLTVRLPGARRGRQPLRVVLDSQLRLSARRRVFQASPAARIAVATALSGQPPRAHALARRGISIWSVGTSARGVNLRGVLSRLVQEGCTHVLVEGGAQVYASFLRAHLADEVWMFVAPKVLGAEAMSWVGPGLGTRLELPAAGRIREATRSGDDVLLVVDLLP